MSKITIVLAEDHHVVREALRTTLNAEPDLSVIGEASDGLEAVSLVQQRRPNVLLIDVIMPGVGGLEATRQVTERFPKTRVIMLSMHDNEVYVLQALKYGAAGYVLKESDMADLIRAIHEVMAGRRYLSPPLSERAIEAYLQQAEDAGPDKFETLTPREREVLHLAAEGLSNREIGERLSISHRTVETHRSNMMHKLELDTQVDLVRYALKHGIIPLQG